MSGFILDFSEPVGEKLWKSKSLEFESWERIDRGNPFSFLSVETQFRFLIDRSNPLSMVTKIIGQTSDLEGWSTFWIIFLVFTQTSNFRIKTHFCVSEDNEAVIKMINEGRSPTMRHVSRTHRVALDWSFDRINWDPTIQIKYIDTKNQSICLHANEGKFHTWRMESSVVFVQLEPS